MMRLVVFSDSHGDVASLQMAIEKEHSADAFIFLGDGLNDFEYCRRRIYDKICVAVKGNCDSFFLDYPKSETVKLGGKTVYCTHGDLEKVKFGPEMIKGKAEASGFDIVLFGHTHKAMYEYNNGIHYLNPGSVRENSYGIIDIEENGIMCFHKKIVSAY